MSVHRSHCRQSLKALLVLLAITLASPTQAAPLSFTVARGDTGGTIGPLNTIGDDLCPVNPSNGCDFDPDDNLLRNNDGISYLFSVQVDPPGDNVTLTTELKPGLVWDSLPPQCNPLTSTLSGDGSAGSPSLLVCDLGFQSAYAEDLNFVARALGDNPNNTTTGLASAEFSGDASTTIVDNLSSVPDVSLTSAPRMNLRKSYLTARPETVSGILGMSVWYTYWIETWQHDTNGNTADDPDPLLGNEMVNQPISFTEDLSSISPSAFVVSCNVSQGTSAGYPYTPFNAAAPESSVLNAGTNNCSATGPTATGSVTVTHSGADLSLSHYPSNSRNGNPFPGDRRIAAFGTVRIHIPKTDFDAAGGSIPATNTMLGFEPTSISNQDNFAGVDQNAGDNGLDATAEDKSDNQHSRTFVEGTGSFSHTYRCSTPIVGPHSYCSATNSAGPNAAWWDSPTSGSAVWSGDGAAEPQQAFGSYTFYRNNGFAPINNQQNCTVIDSSLFEVADYAPGVGAQCVSTCGTQGVDYVIEYGVGYANAVWPPATGAAVGTEIQAECDAPASAWHPTTTAARAAGSITKVRMRRLTPLGSGGATALATNLQALPDTGDPNGTLLESWGTYRNDEQSPSWRECRYNSGAYPAPAHTTNGCGDRVYLTRSLARIEKKTVPSDLVNTIAAGGTVLFELTPSFVAESGSIQDTVDIVDILPPQFEYVPNSATQGGVAFEPNVTGTIVTGQTLTWPLGLIPANVAIGPIQLAVRTPLSTPNGLVMSNTARIDAPTDASSDQQRGDVRNVTVVAPASMLMGKSVDQNLVDRDTAFVYTVEYLNSTTVAFNEMEVIDVLPHAADSRIPATSFVGSISLGTVTPQSTSAQFYVTKDSPVGMITDPGDAVHNLATGSVSWCAMTATHTLNPSASPTIGGSSSACPADGSEVRAIRLVDTQTLPSATLRSFQFQLIPSGNAGGDIYTNQAQGMADGITLRPRTPFATTRVQEEPAIGLAKAVHAIDGNQITYHFLIENIGDTPFTGLSLIDDLDTTFGAGNYSIATAPSVVTPPVTGTVIPNAGFTGSTGNTGNTGTLANNDLLDSSAAASLPPGESSLISVTVQVDTVVDQGNGLGVYENTATTEGTTAAGNSASDTSDNGTETDTDNNGDAGGPDESDPTPATLQPAIGTAKSVTSATAVGDGTYDVIYSLVVTNVGAVPLHDVQLTDDLSGPFGSVQSNIADVDQPGEYIINQAAVISQNAADPLNVQAAFTGATPNIELLDLSAGGSLEPGESITMSFGLRFYPDFAMEPYNNQATALADSVDDDATDPTGGVTDLSDDGTDPDPNSNGVAGDTDEDDPTPLMIPLIGVAKNLASVEDLGSNVFRVTFDFAIQNLSAFENANNIQLTDDLSATFPSPVTYSNISVTAAGANPNPSFDGSSDQNLLLGSDNLTPLGSATASLTLDVSTGGNNGPFSNQVRVTTADTPGGTPTATDLSDDGAEPDSNGDGSAGGPDENDQTVFQLPPQELGLAKQLASATQVGATEFDLDYVLVVSNLSTELAATNVQVQDNLLTTFPGAALIAVASPPTISGDLTAVNPGFNGASDINLLGGNESLAVGESATIRFTVRVDLSGIVSNGPFNNLATASASNTLGGPPITTDSSDDGADPTTSNSGSPNDTGGSDDPTPFLPDPQSIGIAKDLGSVTEVTTGIFDVTFDLLLKNLSDQVDATNVQITEDLTITFGSAASFSLQSLTAPNLSVNAAYNGNGDTNLLSGTDTLAPGQSETLVLVVRVDTGGNLGPYTNQVLATSAATPGGTPIATDLSDDGTNPDADGNGDGGGTLAGDPENDPTVFQLPPQQVSLAKQLSASTQVGPTSYRLDYSFVVANTSPTEVATNVQVADDLNLTFPGVTSIVVSSAPTVSGGLTLANNAFNGQSDIRLLIGNESLAVGAQATINLSLIVDFGSQSGTFLNSATASAANSPGGAPIVTDSSDDGTDPNSSNSGSPGDTGSTDDPTPVTLDPQAIGLAKNLVEVVEISPTQFDVSFDLLLANLSSSQASSNLQIIEDLSATFTGTSAWSLTSVTPGTLLTVNPSFNGSSNTNLLVGNGSLAPNTSDTIRLLVRVDTGGFNGPFTNQATATSAATAGGTPIATDLSDAGTNPDGNGNGNASQAGEDDPNVFQLPPQEVGLAKRVSDFRQIASSQYEIDFELVVSNLSVTETATNLQISDNLVDAFPNVASLYLLPGSLQTGSLTPTSNYDGIVNLNLLAGTDSLPVGGSATITMTVVVDFAGGIAPFLNQAEATVANTPGGDPINRDSSDDGTDPNGTNPGSPGDTGSSDDPTPIEIPNATLAKGASAPLNVSGPLYDVTYTLVVRNTGTVALSGVQLQDDIASALAPATLVGAPTVRSNGFTGPGTVDTSFDGTADTNLLTGDVQLAVGTTGTVTIDVRFSNETGAPGTTNTALLSSAQTPPTESQASITVISQDSDGDGVPDNLETGDRDGDGIPDAQDFDPMGYFYCEDNGEILTGGRIEVRTPSGALVSNLGTTNGVTLSKDGSDGEYRFFYDGTPGIYEIIISQLPAGAQLSAARLPAGVLDVSSVGENPVILGSSEFGDSNTLADFSAAANSPHYLQLDFESGDPDVLLNNIPFTGCAGNSGSITLGKAALDDTVVVGDFVSYSLSLTNNESFFLTDVTVNDQIPPGFAYVQDSAQIVRAGVQTPIGATGQRPVTFDVGQMDAGEELQITYLLRSGAGIVQGNYVNTAIAQVRGTDGSNSASAQVEVVADPLVNITRIVGKVWHDRDGDGWQDPAWANDLRLIGGPYGKKGRRLGDLRGRTSEALDLEQTTLSNIKLDGWDHYESIYLVTEEGTRFVIQGDGEIVADHFGDMKRGLTAQDLRLTLVNDTLSIVNHGIHEEGLAGVRLATVEGLVIETDQQGRYHIEAIDDVKWDIGSNYIVKLDKASLPDGSEVTTENPRVERLTQSLMSDIDFGVQLPEQVQLVEASKVQAATTTVRKEVVETFSEQAAIVRFASGRHVISDNQISVLRDKLATVEGKRNVRLKFLGHTDNEPLSPRATKRYGTNQGLSDYRAQETAAYVINKLGLDMSIADTQGFGASQPVASNESNAGRALNRRVEVQISYDQISFVEETVPVERQVAITDGFDKSVSRLKTVTETVSSRVSEVRFASGKHAVSNDSINQLRSELQKLAGKKNLRVRFSGHTDNEQLSAPTRAIYRDNLGLSEYRAKESATFVASQLGLSANQIEVVGYGEEQPISSNDTGEGRAQNRRVEIDILYDEEYKETVTERIQKFVTIESDANERTGVVRATDDQSLADPRLAFVSEYTTVTPNDGNIRVHTYTNYPAYLDELTVELFAAHDHDFDRVIYTSSVKVEHEFDVLNAIALPVADLEPGQTYQYRLVAKNKAGFKDVTRARTLQVVTPNRISNERQAVGPEGIFGVSDLEQQTVPVPAGRIRVVGHDIDSSYWVSVNAEPMLIDEQRAFVLETHLAPGVYQIPVRLHHSTGTGADVLERNLDLSIGDSYLFMVGLANLTFGGTDFSGAVETLAADDRYEDDSYTSGRLAFYLKGKIKGKYLVTAQLDTTEDEIGNLTDNIKAKDPTSIFRRLEPDQYYPVYGDDSTLRSDTDSQGAFYVRVDWDKSKALWGNFNTGLTANEFAQYNRSLYGAQLVYKQPRYTKHNESRFQGELFVSEAQTVAAHNEFTATGGSLYYLNHTDVVRGSEKISVEVRRRGTTQVLENLPLQPGKDYQFDQFQGRIILNRPLSMISRDHFANIIRTDSLEGDDVYLIADFEYIARDFDADDLTLGAAGTAWITDSLGLGGTYVRESRAGDDYQLKGLDLTLRKNEGTYLKLEVAESDAVAASSQRSLDGGLTFENIAPIGTDVSGRAWGVEAQTSLGEFGKSDRGKIRAWHKDRDAGFSSSRESSELTNTKDSGIEANVRISDRLDLIAHANELKREGQSRDRTISLQANAKLGEKFTAAVEGRYEELNDLSGSGFGGEAILLGARLGYKPNANDEIYIEGQTVLDDRGNYENNERITIGAYRTFSEKFGAGLELSEGSRGEAITGLIDWKANDAITLNLESGFGSGAASTAGATLNLADDYQIYGSYGVDADRTLGRSRKVSTIGQRKSFGNRLTLFNEHQWTHGQYESVATDVFGIDLGLTEEWSISTSVQTNDADIRGQDTKRRAATVGLSYQKDKQRLGVSLERRLDETGGTELGQWLLTSAFEYQFNDAWRSVTRLNWSETDDKTNGGLAARFTEGTVGFAYRPVKYDRWQVLTKYTYLFDLVAPQQSLNRPDQRSNVGSLEVLYDVSRRWELGGKLAARRSKIRTNRDSGPWFRNGVNLAVARARYHVNHQWDGLLEYRYLQTVEFDDSRSGALIGLYRHLGGHMKLGVGYNFTDYSDDLTNLDYDGGGWYIDIIGKW